MNLRKVEAPTIGEAIRRIKATLGDDAVILGTRTRRKGGVMGVGGREVVEVYVDDTRDPRVRGVPRRPVGLPAQGDRRPGLGRGGPEAPPDRTGADAGRRLPPGWPAPPSDRTRGTIVEALGALRREIKELLDRSAVPDGDAHRCHPVVQQAFRTLRELDMSPEAARALAGGLEPEILPAGELAPDALRALLSRRIRRLLDVPQVPATEGRPRVVVMVGPTGVGKTTTIAKLAAHGAVSARERVGLIGLDTSRIGALDELRRYAEIIGVPLEVVREPEGLRASVDRLRDRDVVYVDTAGRSPRDEPALRGLSGSLDAVPEAEVLLVLSLAAGRRAMRLGIEGFRSLGPAGIVLTKLDEADRLGGIVDISLQALRPIVYVTAGRGVPRDIERATPERMTRWILGEECIGRPSSAGRVGT